MSQQCPPPAAASPPDPDALTYTVQHQVLGSDQWTALATGLREPGWAATGLRKGVQHTFRVLSTTIKSSSKPSPPSEPAQLLERGESGYSSGVGWRLQGQGTGSSWWRLKGWSGPASSGGNSMAGGHLSQSERFFLLTAACTVGEAEALGSDKPGGAVPAFLAAYPRQIAEPL